MRIENDTPNIADSSVGTSTSVTYVTVLNPGDSYTPGNVESGQTANVELSGRLISGYSTYWLSPEVSNDGTVTMTFTVE